MRKYTVIFFVILLSLSNVTIGMRCGSSFNDSHDFFRSRDNLNFSYARMRMLCEKMSKVCPDCLGNKYSICAGCTNGKIIVDGKNVPHSSCGEWE